MSEKDLEDFLGELLNMGFGRMKPAHYESYLFYKLRKAGYFKNDQETYNEEIAARKLKLDLKSLRKLKTNSDKLFALNEKVDLKIILKKLLRDEHFDFSRGQVRFQITDATVREDFKEFLIKHRLIVDGSFNSTIVTVPVVDFLRILDKLAPSRKIAEIFEKRIREIKGPVKNQIEQIVNKPDFPKKDIWDRIAILTNSLKDLAHVSEVAAVLAALAGYIG